MSHKIIITKTRAGAARPDMTWETGIRVDAAPATEHWNIGLLDFHKFFMSHMHEGTGGGWNSHTFKTHGEALEEQDDEGNELTFTGETGWYDCDGDMKYPASSYPYEAADWARKGVSSFRDDVWTYALEVVKEEVEEELA